MKLFSTLAFLALTLGLSPAETKSTLNATDEKFVKHEAMHCHSAVIVGELGVKKASSAAAKSVATLIVKDHTLLCAELAALAKVKGVEISSANDPKADEMIAVLEKESGASFDKTFLTHLQKHHKAMLTAYDSAMKECKDAELIAWIKATLPKLQAHLEEINKALGV